MSGSIGGCSIRGVIDLDVGNLPSPRVKVLGRYSFENYLLDPLVVYALLNEEGTARPVQGVSISRGDEHLIRGMSQASLQLIADAVLNRVEQTLMLGQFSPTQSIRQTVTFTSGISLQYPNWMFTWQGHDLLAKFQSCFGGHQVIQLPRLYKQFRRVRLVPTELVTLMQDLKI